MPDQSFMPSSQSSHPPEVTLISLLRISLEDMLGWFHMAWPLLPPPVLRWNGSSSSRGMKLGKGSSLKEPLRTA